jgi:hypothetical protein
MSDKARAKRLWDGFRLTPEEWQIIDTHQGSVCAFCQKRQRSGIRLATDHDHKTGLVRGLLCSQCNRLLGRLERQYGVGIIDALVRISAYIMHPPAVSALGKQVFGFPGRIGTKRHRAAVKKGTF